MNGTRIDLDGPDLGPLFQNSYVLNEFPGLSYRVNSMFPVGFDRIPKSMCL